MDTPTTETWRAVLALLVVDPAAVLHSQAMQAAARLAKVHPVALVGDPAPLNHLTALETRDPGAYAGMMALIERKRAALGLEPLEPLKDEGFDKAEYMRHFMAQKRQRLVRAADIENMARGERDKLRGTPRLEFMRVQGAKWNDELERRIEVARKAAGGKRIPRPKLDALRAQFWAWVDQQLDDAENAGRTGR